MRPLLLRLCPLAIAFTTGTSVVPVHAALLPGTVLTSPGTIVSPGLVPPGTPAGTLLASLTSPFNGSFLGLNLSFTLTSAVFRNPTGTLDFYYQLANSANSVVGTIGLTLSDFDSFLTATGVRADGATLPGGSFVNGTAPAVVAGRSADGSLIGFEVQLPPGTTSQVMVVSTDAINYSSGNALVNVLEESPAVGPVATFQPAGPATVPDSGTTALLFGFAAVVLLSVRSLLSPHTFAARQRNYSRRP